MKAVLFKNSVIKLLVFFENSPNRLKGLSVKDYKLLLKSINFLIRHSPESTDLKGISKVLKLTGKQNYLAIINQIDKRKTQLKIPEALMYSEIQEILKFMLHANEKLKDVLTNQDWLELSVCLEPFDREIIYQQLNSTQ